MNIKHTLATAIALGALAVMTACARTPDAADSSAPAVAQALATPPQSVSPDSAKPDRRAGATLPRMVVYKSPSCGCCGSWVEHVRAAGFDVEVRNQDNVNPVKERVGVPLGKGSCHTAEVGGYFVEGHVPAEDIKRLLAEEPDAKGLILPGMPAGSPGMEMPDGRTQPYMVELVGRDGSTMTFAQH